MTHAVDTIGNMPKPASPKTFGALIAAQAGLALPTEDLIHVMIPLMREVAALHGVGNVAALGPSDVVETDDGALSLARPQGQLPKTNFNQIREIQPHAGSALKIVGEYRVTNDEVLGRSVEDLRAVDDEEAKVAKPIYLSGYRSWEREIGHHDEITDVFAIGLILASLACGLDFNEAGDVERFSTHWRNLFGLQPRLHPVVATLILETTALNRHERATDLAAIARRLETYREQPAGLEVERVLAGAKGTPGRRTAVLAHLRDRLFDLSHRNRLIYFRPTQASVNLTEASVPMVLRIESIRGDQLCTWGDSFARDVLSGSPMPLAKWLRFEDQPYLPSAFDRIIQETRRDRAEYGFSHLRLVIGFLRWHNFKDAPDERIVSPLLWLPVEVTKTKGVRDQYMLRCTEAEAEFNPALRHYLRQLYDIQLPETVDLTQTSLAQVHEALAAQIHRTEPGVRLDLQQRPAVRLIHQKAVQRVRQFERRRSIRKSGDGIARPDFSYDRDDYRPLGFALFEKYVRPSPLPQRLAAGGDLRPRAHHMVAVTERQTINVGVDEGHRFSWELDLTHVTLANFNYKKMSLVRDYTELIQSPVEQPAFDRVFSIDPRPFDDEAPPPVLLADQWNVVASDATQDAAVAMARTRRSFIIQGPPGTGKSQTITNLIGDYAARGKRVLFVCEKRAALDVVFHRLRQAGLDDLACLIHDSQEDKKGFILDLKACYERWGKGDDRLGHNQALRNRTLAALSRQRDAIVAFDAAMGAASGSAGDSLRALIRRAAALPLPDDSAGPRTREQLPTPQEWDENRALINRTARTMADVFGLAGLAEHPFARLNGECVTDRHCYARVEALVDEGERHLTRLDPLLDDTGSLLSADLLLADALLLARTAQRALDTGLAHNIAFLEAHSTASIELEAARAVLTERREARAAAAEGARHWSNPLQPEDAAAALDQARRQEGSFFKFFSGSWRRLKRTVAARYDFEAHAVKPSLTGVLERLQVLHAAEAACLAEQRAIERRFNTRNLNALLDCRADLTGALPTNGLLRSLVERAGAAGDPAAVIAREAAATPALEALSAVLDRAIDGAAALTLAELAEALRDMREGLEDLPDVLPVLVGVHGAGPHLSFALRNLALPPDGIEALVIDEAIARVERAEPELRRFDIDRMLSATRRATRARDLLRQQNAATIRTTLHRQFRDHVKKSMQSVTQLDSEGKRFKKRYATGRRELEHEFGKTMRFRSIRDLASGDSGLVVNDLKPIWLMSPLSVSDTLPLDSGLFDVVIFDEASQIPTEEAVPALSRAGQAIVVGDEMQLPPTSFFSTALDDDDLQVMAEEDGETIAILLDADSLLNQAARNLPATMLAWHYRSRYEALISFSNAAFYNGQLVTIPDRNIAQARKDAGPIKSDEAGNWKAGADRLLAAPISMHRIADGLYDQRSNPPEARYIAGLVREILRGRYGQSIGIVAFSEAQQSEIESALDALAAKDSDFAAMLEREYVREDDGQFNGLFVKNLENVQGDERDIILLSICYAPGRDGRMAMNFGPINQRGGEKRLNVIFSRARRHMAVVSTIGAEAITNTHNDGARALRTFLAFAEAQVLGTAEHARSILATLNPDAERTFGSAMPPDSVRTALADSLRARGHVVHEHVGSASFRCDLAIMGKDAGHYALAILLDRDGDARLGVDDRFLFRPAILRAFGWRVLDVPVSRWLRDKAGVVARIEAELDRDSWQEQEDDPFVESISLLPIPQADAPAPADAVPPAPAPVAAPSAPEMLEFRFSQGTSHKFWKIGIQGNDMIVIFGRVGTKGQTVVKTFETEDRARREADKLTREKTRKGYEPAE